MVSNNKLEYKHYLQIDLLKGIAIIFVIILHLLPINITNTSNALLMSSYLTINNSVLINLALNLTLYQAVPIFFVLMGLNMGSSFKRRNYVYFNQLYSKEYFKSRFDRIVIPFIFIFIISLIFSYAIKGNILIGYFTILGLLPFTGPGNYFISILLQFIIIFPLLYLLYRYNPLLTLISCFVINFIFEIAASMIPFLSNNSYLYAASILRYLFLIVLGLWASDNFKLDKIIHNKYIIIGLLIGIFYIFINSLFSLNFPCFQPYWGIQNILSSFYPFIICILGIKYFPNNSINKTVNFVGYIGKASYHIFLMQILFFGLFWLLIIKLNMNNIPYYLIIFSFFGIISFVILLGLLFFKMHNKLVNNKR